MLLPVKKLFDVRLNTGRYVLYKYADINSWPRWRAAWTEKPAGFVLDEGGNPIWISAIFGGSGRYTGAAAYSDFVVYSERTGGAVVMAVPRFDVSLRVIDLYAMYNYANKRGQVHALFHQECSHFDRVFTPCGRKQFIGKVASGFVFYDGELFHCFYWTVEGRGWDVMHLIKLSPNLEVERYVEVRLPNQAVNAWVCKRASTHNYVGLLWTGDRYYWVGRVYAIRRIDREPYVAFDLMYDISAMGGELYGAVSTYVDDSCFAGLLLVSRAIDRRRVIWHVYTFKWTPGQSFPPPLTLRATFRGEVIFAAMISPDDYVVAYLYYNEEIDRDELRIIGADNYVYYGDPYLVDLLPREDTNPYIYAVNPSGIIAQPIEWLHEEYNGTEYRFMYALLYLPYDRYWRHMHRDKEVRVRRGSACRRLSDGSYACLDVGVKVPLGCYPGEDGVHVVLYNFETGRLEDYAHTDAGRVKVGDYASPFSLPSRWFLAWEFPLVIDGARSYFFAADGDMVRLVKLHAPSKLVATSDLRLSEMTLPTLRLKKVGRELHVAATDYSRITRAIVDAETMRTVYTASIPYDCDAYGLPLAVVPVWVEEKGRRYVALVVAFDKSSWKIAVHLAADDGTIVSASADSPDAMLDLTPQRGVSVDAWWDGRRVFAVVAAIPLRFFYFWEGGRQYAAKLLWVKYDANGFRYGVLRELKPSGYTLVDRRPMYALITKVRVYGWERWGLLLDPDDDFIYPPKQWLAEGVHPLFTCETVLPPILGWIQPQGTVDEFMDVAPLQASQDGSVIFSYSGYRSPDGNVLQAFAVMPPLAEVGSFFYIAKALPASRSLRTLFRRGRVGRW
ncbi:MAG: hypothetical protein QXU64_05670 [Thermofilaceae archaeon]